LRRGTLLNGYKSAEINNRNEKMADSGLTETFSGPRYPNPSSHRIVNYVDVLSRLETQEPAWWGGVRPYVIVGEEPSRA
jgi:hypothetical protein